MRLYYRCRIYLSYRILAAIPALIRLATKLWPPNGEVFSKAILETVKKAKEPFQNDD